MEGDDAKPRLWLVTVAGPDRPGIIAAISRVLAEARVDIEDVSMSRLSGNFAMMLLARGSIHASLIRRLSDAGGAVGVHVHIDGADEKPAEPEPNIYVAASGANQIGIVAALAGALADAGASIAEMETRLLHSTQVPVYLVRLEACHEGPMDALRASLDEVGRRLGIEVRCEAIERSDL